MFRPKNFIYLCLLCLGLAGCLPESADQITVEATREQPTATIAVAETETAVPTQPPTAEPTPEPSPLPPPAPTAVPTDAPAATSPTHARRRG